MTSPTDFDARAATWDDDPAKADRARRVADLILQSVPDLAVRSVLEYGAGTGLLGFRLLPGAAAVTFADTSTGMLEVVERKIRAAGAARAVAVALDLTRDPAPPTRFGLICSLLTMHHVPDVDVVLAKFRDLLEPGGYLFVSDLDLEDGSFHGAGVDVHPGFDRGDFGARLARAGFGPVTFSTPFEMRKVSGEIERTYPVFLAATRRP